MGRLHEARRWVRDHVGVDIARWPDAAPLLPIARLLVATGTDLVLDVGASDGRYVRELRALGYAGPAVSFEPLPGDLGFGALERAAAGDRDWRVHPYALGDDDREVEIHVAGNAGASSSLLPMLPGHEDAAPESRYVDTVTVPQRRLDGLWAEVAGTADRAWLKVDVQGYEQAVLAGAEGILDRVVALQLEASLVPLYAGAWSWLQLVDWVEDHGFAIAQLLPGFTDDTTGRLLQLDVVAVRPGSLPSASR